MLFSLYNTILSSILLLQSLLLYASLLDFLTVWQKVCENKLEQKSILYYLNPCLYHNATCPKLIPLWLAKTDPSNKQLNDLKTEHAQNACEIMHKKHSTFSAKDPHVPLWEQTCSGFFFHFHQTYPISTISKFSPSTAWYLLRHKAKFCFKLQRTVTPFWEPSMSDVFSTSKAIQLRGQLVEKTMQIFHFEGFLFYPQM